MTLHVIGLSHKTAPAELRERLAFAEGDLGPAAVALRDLDGIQESFLLSTCNRTEVYLVADGGVPLPAVIHLLGTVRSVEQSAFAQALYVQQGVAAARHALRVSAGLDSMVIGEQQILGQVRRAFDIARAAGTTGPVLNRLMQLAIATGRRVRRETGLSRYAPSVPRAALGLCQRILGTVRDRPVLVVGAGKVASLVVQVFGAAGGRIAAVANRTLEAARTLGAQAGAAAVPLEAIATASHEVDIVVVCTGAATPVVTTGMLGMTDPRPVPLLVVDLGIPRGVDPSVAALPGVTLRVLDDLAPYGAAPVPAEALERAEAMVEVVLQRYERWMASRAAVPLIEALRTQAEAIVEGELRRARGRLRHLDDGQREAVRAVVGAAMRKLLHGPVVRLRESAARDDTTTLRVARELFGLHGEREHREGSR